MSPWSKISFVVAVISCLIILAVYFILGGVWIPILYFFVVTMALSLGAAIVLDWKLYVEFFLMRTTKHGMNMGMMILLSLTALVCINYLGVHYNKTFDLTAEKLYSLSDQTKKLISGLDSDVDVKVFYKGPAGLTEKGQITKVLDLYKDFSNKVKINYYNTYKDQAEATQYLTQLSDKDSAKAFAFVEVKGKKIRVESPFDENQFTGAMIKASRRGEKKIYFLKGHGERDLESENPDGLKVFKEALEGQAFKVESLNLLEKNEIPKDADFLAIVGPKTNYLDPELEKLRDYMKTAGRLLVAIDPGQRQNLAGFLKSFGVEFMNNYVISLSRNGYTPMAVGLIFSPLSKVTESFQTGKDNNYAVFDLASEMRTAPDKPGSFKVTEIVKTSPNSLAVSDLQKELNENDLGKMQTFALGMEVTGRMDEKDANGKVTETNAADEKNKQFELLAYGDSDFMSNQAIFLGVNRDLALNSAADLAHETDLIGSHPKSYKGTVLDIGRYQQLGVIGGGIGLPIFLLISSGVMWFRRRGA